MVRGVQCRKWYSANFSFTRSSESSFGTSFRNNRLRIIERPRNVQPFVYNQSNGRCYSMRKDISTAEIVRLYAEEKAALRTIATRLGVSVELVRGRLEKAGLRSRTAGEGKHLSQLRRMEMEIEQAIERGKKFGSWTVIGPFKIGNLGRTYWKCRCDCARQTEKFIRLDMLKVGGSTSCGECPIARK